MSATQPAMTPKVAEIIGKILIGEHDTLRPQMIGARYGHRYHVSTEFLIKGPAPHPAQPLVDFIRAHTPLARARSARPSLANGVWLTVLNHHTPRVFMGVGGDMEVTTGWLAERLAEYEEVQA